jgi:ADP-ribose pyrophosphatase YjhB (NUDIX family)
MSASSRVIVKTATRAGRPEAGGGAGGAVSGLTAHPYRRSRDSLGNMVIACVGAIVRDGQGRILVVRRRHPPNERMWSIPGGRVEPGETEVEAVQREVLEETGLHVEVAEAAGSEVIPAVDESDRYLVTDYFASLTAGDPGHPAAADDAAEARWVSAAEFFTLDLTPNLADTLARWRVWE